MTIVSPYMMALTHAVQLAAGLALYWRWGNVIAILLQQDVTNGTQPWGREIREPVGRPKTWPTQRISSFHKFSGAEDDAQRGTSAAATQFKRILERQSSRLAVFQLK